LYGEVVTLDEITRDKEKAKNNHVEATYPGQLVSEDTFYEIHSGKDRKNPY
jgi:hypothetical protein